jgi:hypothetical protein
MDLGPVSSDFILLPPFICQKLCHLFYGGGHFSFVCSIVKYRRLSAKYGKRGNNEKITRPSTWNTIKVNKADAASLFFSTYKNEHVRINPTTKIGGGFTGSVIPEKSILP